MSLPHKTVPDPFVTFVMTSTTASLKSTGLLRNHRASHTSCVTSRRQNVSPSLPSLKHEMESSNASTYSADNGSCSLTLSSLQKNRSYSSRLEECNCTTANACRLLSPSMETQSHPRRFKQTNQWLFRVGEHADERSHGKGQSAARRWSMKDFDLLHEIGEGCFGSIRLALDVDREEYVALKQVTRKVIVEKGNAKYLRGEVEIQTR